jgi:hypothetical protein
MSDTYLQKNHSQTASANYQKHTVILLLIFALFKSIFAFDFELGNDEAYYWVFAQYPEWNYFDHPPMVGVWIRLFTANMLLDDFEGFVRMGSIIGSVLSSWFLFKAVSLMHSERAGFFAACMYQASFYAGITAGLYILPDSPQMVFWTFSMWMLVRIIQDENKWLHWILFGIGAGFCIMSKVHGVFLWFGFGLYILFYRPRWLIKPKVYLSFLISLIIFSPIILWNLKYDFITYRFHSERVVIDSFALKTNSFFKEFLNQVTLNNTLNVGLAVCGIVLWKKKKIRQHEPLKIYNLIGLPLAILLLIISLFRNTVLPHWNGPAYVTLVPLGAIALAELTVKPFPNILKWSLAIFAVGLCGMWVLINFIPGTYGHKDNINLGRTDLTLDMYGWEEGGKQFVDLYKKDVEAGIMPEGSPLVSDTWGSAHAEYYFGRPAGLQLFCMGPAVDIHQYLWINQYRMKHLMPETAYSICSSTKTFNYPRAFYQRRELAKIFYISRNGKPAQRFYVFRLKGLKKEVSTVKDILK